MITENLVSLATPIEDLALLPGNPRRGDVDAIAASLAAFGQRKPIVANRSTGVVIAGNHTLQAARQLAWTHVAVVWVDDDPTTASAYALADNRTSQLGGYDPEALAALIMEVQDNDDQLLAAIGYTLTELDDLLADPTGAFVPGDGLEDVARLDRMHPDMVTCPACGHEWDRRGSS